jgi:lipopolysaccharide/colanic/teichoic acid biosynthesis glycosyltransferase
MSQIDYAFRQTADFSVVRESALKRLFDVLLAGSGILASSPLWLLFAVLIKFEDGGAVFYTQPRVGRGGRLFRSMKFRSMVQGADRKYGPKQASENDCRVTQIGRLLRATAMDELPQLWNIFTGDMSFVGPRALMPNEIEVGGDGRVSSLEDVPGYRKRHMVRPGLTGIAQIYASRDIPRKNKFRYDLLYIQKRTFWLDVRLILVSFWISLRGRWESREDKF